MINCNLKCDSYHTCCVEFNKTNIDEDNEDGYVNEDEDNADEKFYLPYINSIKDLNKSCENYITNANN